MDPFVAEIRIFPFTFAPKGWAFCMGQLMPISQNTALFSLVGTAYGGDGKSTFALPDMQGNVPMHVGSGQGSGLSPRFQGEMGGSEFVTLLESEIPVHSHGLMSIGSPGNRTSPVGNSFARPASGSAYAAAGPAVAMSAQSISVAGASLPHNNMQPYLTLNFCIALQGVFPARH